MMAIISDIHGNYSALMSVLESIDSIGVKDIYCLGDVVGYYTDINKCCNELRRRNVSCIMGNHDFYMISGNECPRSNSVNKCLEYQRKIIDSENLYWLKSLRRSIVINDLNMVHGGWKNDVLDEYVNPNYEYFKDLQQRYFCSGHTHRPLVLDYNDKVYCNPGSVGQPRDNDCRASYALFDSSQFEIIRVEYDIQQVCTSMRDAGFSEYFYKRLWYGSPNFHN